METKPNEYEPGIDQNQGVVGPMARNQQHGDTEAEGTQAPDLDPNLVMNQAREEGENGSVEGAPDAIGEQEFVNDEGVD
jgi:hypothetical protein